MTGLIVLTRNFPGPRVSTATISLVLDEIEAVQEIDQGSLVIMCSGARYEVTEGWPYVIATLKDLAVR